MLYHQVDVKGLSGGACYVFHVIQRHGKIGNISSVHDINMERIDSASLQFPDLFFQISVIGTHHGCCQFKIHLLLPFLAAMYFSALSRSI